jgi:antitoxin component YwqK of YwqJK toxin-antitoxin module
MQRSGLVLRDGVLYLPGQTKPFSGLLVEDYAPGKRKAAIPIAAGKADGISRGWFDNGQIEVEETFVHGTSEGTRQRWFTNSQLRSQEPIVHGQLAGHYTEWHDNGRKAAEMDFVAGQPDGVAMAWHRSGQPKSRTRLSAGKVVEQQFFADAIASANPTAP